MTVGELREWYKKQADAIGKINLTSLNKVERRSYPAITVDNLKTYFRNPFNHQTKINKAAQYFFRSNTTFRQVIYFYATMFMPEARTVVPRYNLSKKTSGADSKTIKGYYQTLSELEKLDLNMNFLRLLINAWIEDVAFGILYEDDNDAFILPLESEYCKICGMNYDGTFSFAYNMDYFRNREYLLDYWGEPFVSMYREYQADETKHWIEVDPAVGVCLKININDPLLSMAPLAGIMIPLMYLSNLQDIQNTKDELSIYKIIVATIPLLDGANLPDDFAVDPDTAVAYYNKLVANLPETVGQAITPVPLEMLDVMEDDTSNTDRITDAQNDIFNKSGVHFLNSTTINSSTQWKIAMTYATNYGLSTLLPQIQAFINRWVLNKVGTSASKVIFQEVSPYTIDTFKESERESCTLGLPNRLLLNSLNGVTEADTLRMNKLEIDVLKLNDAFIPMSTSYTQSSNTVGAPTKSDDEITDAGDRSRDERDRLG